MSLEKITLKQKERLLDIGVNVTDDTLVVEMLQFFRRNYITEKISIPHKHVTIHLNAYFTAKVHGFIPSTGPTANVGGPEDGDCQGVWYSYGTHSWEGAESLALDYIIWNEE